MKIIHSVPEMQDWAFEQKRAGRVIGLVPTMGFLHQGHLSLIDAARKNGADVVAVSIFVNPTQFGPTEDYECYPRDFEHDRTLCEEKSVDVIFAPSPSDMYHPDRSTWVVEETVSRGLCAETRPTHFRGVTTVVAKLFNAVLPDLAVFGQKDAQQAAVIRRMVRDLNFPIRIVTAPLVREADGLAMSSRNKYLSAEERSRALVLFRALSMAVKLLETGEETDLGEVTRVMKEMIVDAGGRPDYVEYRDAETMELPVPGTKVLTFAVAAYFGKTRLIDNMTVHLP